MVTSAIVASQAPCWNANSEVVKRTTAEQPEANFEEPRVGTYSLPELLKSAAGTAVTRETWVRRRAEILEAFRESVYGRPLGRVLPREAGANSTDARIAGVAEA